MKLSFTAFLALANAAVATAVDMSTFSFVFSMTNDMEKNEVIAWQRDTETGELHYPIFIPTGGAGGSISGPDATLTPSFPNPPDPFASQDPMVVAGRCLLVVNGGSDELSSLQIIADTKIRLAGVYSTGGSLPISVAALDDLVYVLNANGNGSIQGYRLNKDNCSLTAIGETIELDQNAVGIAEFGVPFGPVSPAQIGFTPAGDILVSIKGDNGVLAISDPSNPGFGSINHYKIGPDGTTSADTLTKTLMPRPVSAPFAFDFNTEGTLLLNEGFIEPPFFPSGVGGVSFWEETDGAYTEITDHVSTGQGFSCWIRWNPVNECMYITNSFGDGSISTMRAAAGGGYELVESIAAGLNGPLDLVFSADSRYLYVYSPGFAPSTQNEVGQPKMIVYEMDLSEGNDCGLTLVEEETEGYAPIAERPVTTNPTGVAIFPDFNQVSSGAGEGMAPPDLEELVKAKGFVKKTLN